MELFDIYNMFKWNIQNDMLINKKYFSKIIYIYIYNKIFLRYVHLLILELAYTFNKIFFPLA